MGNDLVTKVCLFVTFRVLGHRHYTKKTPTISRYCRSCTFTVHFCPAFCDPAGARTQDPNIKSVVLYQLSYGIIRANPELSVLVVQMYRKFLFCQNKTIFLYGILIIVNLKTR